MSELLFNKSWKIVHVFAILFIIVFTVKIHCLSHPIEIELIVEPSTGLDTGTKEIELENGERVSVYEG